MANCWSRCSSRSCSPTPALFPPEAAAWKRRRPPSEWREFHFMLHQVQPALRPSSPLPVILDEWADISEALAAPQLAAFFD